MAEYKTVRKNAQDQFVEKRSRFIGYACPVQTEQEALDFIRGGTSDSVRTLTEKMNEAAENLDFELAARIRDQIGRAHV